MGRPLPIWKIALRRVFVDLALLNISLFLTLGLSGVSFETTPTANIVGMAAALNAVGLLLVIVLRIYRISARYAGIVDLTTVFLATVLMSFASLGFGQVFFRDREGHSALLPVLFGLIFLSLWAGIRFVHKIRQFPQLLRLRVPNEGRNTIIVGAGDAGDMVARELLKMPAAKAVVVGFVDDDVTKQGSAIQGIPVLGRVSDLETLVPRYGVDEVVIAIPSASGNQMRRIWEACSLTPAVVRTLPAFDELVGDKRQIVNQLREFRVQDLLRRDSHADDMDGRTDYLRGETILVTGGGGSIGSELARQVALLNPAHLVLLGKGENSVFEIDQELRNNGFKSSTPVVCDVRDPDGLARVFAKYKPTIVFHAAAHKHVPLMEAVPIEAVANNVFGTLNVATQAVQHGVKRFILVSTDKAVNPQNVMGATKRVAEMIVTAMAGRSETGFSAVRFGNVLGSRGSLVPILVRQIQNGGPLTITHPDMTRFFMTIPEASRLIVQAGAMGVGGEVFILDMGDPVKIVDLAHDMVRMHGLVPNKDIEITFTGIRPGEKMHEELAYAAEQLSPSDHPKIMRVGNDRAIEWGWLKQRLNHLREMSDQGDSEAVRSFLLELAWEKNLPPDAHLASDRAAIETVDRTDDAR